MAVITLLYTYIMAKGKPEENNPKRRPKKPTPAKLFVPLDSPIRKDEKEMRRISGIPQGLSSHEQLKFAEEALRERPPSTSEIHDANYDKNRESY